MTCFLPQDEQKEESLRRLFELLVERFREQNLVHMNTNRTGVIIWYFHVTIAYL